MNRNHRRLRAAGIWIAAAAAVYFGNVELQTWLGRRAMEATGLEMLELDAALVRAGYEGRPVLAELSAIWCSSCRTFDKQVLSDPQVRAMLEREFVFARVEYDGSEGESFRERYGVRGFPRSLVLAPDGRLIARLPTTYDPAEYLSALRDALQASSTEETS